MNQTSLEALNRAQSGLPCANDAAVIMAAEQAGILDAIPRDNVLTFNGWRAKGRTVRKGQRALIKIPVWGDQKDKATGNIKKRLFTSALFHISQTDRLPHNGRK